jgi:hypothetical protein
VERRSWLAVVLKLLLGPRPTVSAYHSHDRFAEFFKERLYLLNESLTMVHY